MLRGVLGRGLDEQRLRMLLVLFFLALALPTGFLIWQAYSQLKWEAFHQYRGGAEELTSRIDARLVAMVQGAEARSFADYNFLVVSGDPSANFLQRSPLSAYPVARDLPGLLGYFQVDTAGEFSTPLLPASDKPAENFGIGRTELDQRQALAAQLQAVLSDNQLVEYRVDELRADAGPTAAAVGSAPLAIAAMEHASEESAPAPQEGSYIRSAPQPVVSKQQAFDDLSDARLSTYGAASGADAVAGAKAKRQASSKLERVGDLQLEQLYQEKDADREQRLQRSEQERGIAARVSRKEQIALPAAATPASADIAAQGGAQPPLRITTFESEIDPLDFSLLGSGHFVLFRKVWRGGERFTQGMLIDQRGFVEDGLLQPFRDTALSLMSDLIVAYQDEVLHTAKTSAYATSAGGAGELEGALLYRNRLSAPFDSLELIYSVRQLPPGPGAAVLGWVSVVLAVVFCSGFYALYRMGLSQISLARQQQDFVSAVSHELKTPLTSIRMYGEMLKEGWAAEDKKQQYYEFIHDESERLARLVANVLQLANISRNQPQLEMRAVSVAELMAACEAKISNQVQRADFELVFERDPASDAVQVIVDQDCFAQIIINLVDNAIKFSRHAQRKRIEICSRLNGDGKALFTVRDFGPGIPKEHMRRIFDMFYRSESELTRETVGTGIGLAIVHQLCAAMAAQVDVLNRNPGAEFRIAVPEASVDSPAVRITVHCPSQAHETE